MGYRLGMAGDGSQTSTGFLEKGSPGVPEPIAGLRPVGWAWRLPIACLLALRYFRSTRKDTSVRFMSSMTSGGIALGVAALILAVAAQAGFQSKLLGQVLARTPVLQVEVPEDADIEAMGAIIDGLGSEFSYQRLLLGRGWMAHAGRVLPVEIVGYEDEIPDWFPGVDRSSSEGAVLAFSVARRWGLRDGQSLELISPRPQLSPIGRIPRNRFVPVAGTYLAGHSREYEHRVAVPLALAESLLWPSDRRLDVRIGDADAEAVAVRLREMVPPEVRVQTSRDLNRSLYFALSLEKSLMFVAVFLIVLVASQSLISSLALLITNKRHEIGMLSALGLPPRQIRRCFVILGAILGTVGIIAGALLGCLAAWLLERYELLSLPPTVYVVDHVPFLVRGRRDLPVILLSAMVLTLTAAYSAGKRASSLCPMAALRR